ncbi:hypothetical protein [uncultured Methanobrevibacter sp.]|uniref:hypothetical protein n=1 Tax=uncultured Methanobrevibacter sp. TaxID=253161 RepID=UPI00260644F4|nr:hypothetical protein [uncultured Methanobrevibacter sp.]
MKPFISQRIDMQIPQENSYTGLTNMPDNDDNFNKLSNDYTITDIDKVKNFTEGHDELLDFIHEITPLLNDYFPNYQKIIEFCEDPESRKLDFILISIKGSKFNEDYETLTKFKNEPIYKSKFSKNINGLVCVELW